MEKVIGYFKQQDQNYWIYNYVASLIYYALNGFHDTESLILFPIAITLISCVLIFEVNQRDHTRYLGFFPLQKDIAQLVILVVVNLVIWKFAGILALIAAIYLFWKNQNRV